MVRKRKSGGNAQATADDLVRLFKESKKPLTAFDLLRALKLHKRELEALERQLLDLQAQGQIVPLRRGAYGLVENLRLVTGTLEVTRSGVGFVIPDDPDIRDIFISPDNFGQAWNGDRVAVAVFPGQVGRRKEGRIARIIERKTTRFTARVSKRLGEHLLCVGTDGRQKRSFLVQTAEAIQEGQVLLVEPTEHMDRDLWAATLLKVLGEEADIAVQEAMVKINHGVPTTFPAKTLQEAAALPPEPQEADFAGRKDLRELDLVTIDGAKAKDFDDAVCVLEEPGGFRLIVAIADVAHYVPEGSALDREAVERGNSYYFPLSVEPMFPEALSNGLCSLKPDVPRLAMVAEMGFTPGGVLRPDTERYYPAVIRSKARITYGQVKLALFDADPEAQSVLAHVLPMLRRAETLARALRARRMERGSLDFDLPEPEILFNLLGETTDIRPKVRHFGHQIIEEFMIAANESVARLLRDRSFPCLYRIHDEPDPDKLQALFELVLRSELAEKVQRPTRAPNPRDLQELLAAAVGTEMEYVVGRLTLRSMMQAKYAPVNTGHYGLASECYCHFTSPIRRYADLVVHRSLKRLLQEEQGGREGSRPKGLKGLGAQLSLLERKAMDAEREILKRITIIFLEKHLGEEFTGVINSITDFGFWVELQEVMAEGLVRLSTLHDDYYSFIPERQELLGERTGRRFRMGRRITVRLAEVNLSRLEVTLELVSGGEGGGEARGRGRKPPRPAPTEGAAKRKPQRNARSGGAKTANGPSTRRKKPSANAKNLRAGKKR